MGFLITIKLKMFIYITSSLIVRLYVFRLLGPVIISFVLGLDLGYEWVNKESML